MKMHPKLLLVFLCFSQASFADCTDVIKLSKITTEVVQNKDSFESNASAFCKEYKSLSSSTKSATYGLSYKFLAASMGNANASETEVASKVCSSDASQASRSDAYRQYVESISDKAYSAYEACERMKGAKMTFTLNSLLNKSITISVGNSTNVAAPAEIAFDTSGDAKCEWKTKGASQETLSLPTGSSALLKCSRKNTDEESAIIITVISDSNGNSLTIPWAALDKDGVPIDHLRLLNKKFETAIANLDIASKQLTSAVVSFSSTQCPSGWEEYAPAYGRFIRGIDKSGGKTDPVGLREPGALQDDQFRKHSHEISLQGASGNRAFVNRGPAWGYDDWHGATSTTSSNEVGADETRPKNVSLLYCVKK